METMNVKDELREIEFKEFVYDLQEWANAWSDDVNQVVVDHIEELFNDDAVRHLVKLNAEENRAERSFNEGYLLEAITYKKKIKQVRHHKGLNDYTHVLYELCYRRFTRKEEK